MNPLLAFLFHQLLTEGGGQGFGGQDLEGQLTQEAAQGGIPSPNGELGLQQRRRQPQQGQEQAMQQALMRRMGG